MSEAEFLGWLRGRLPTPDPSVLVGDGPDDCAFLRPDPGQSLAVTTDTLIENTHFSPDDDPAAVGWKALAVNLSDLAASGCRARWFVAAAGWRKTVPRDYTRRFMEGVLDCAARYRVDLVGGDTTSTDGPSSITITALGQPLPGGPLLRSGARPGDLLAVTGRLGGSILGRHLRPAPRLAEIAVLLDSALRLAAKSGERHPLHAAMDLSDGLGLDATRLLAESGVGGVLHTDRLPCSEAAEHRAIVTGKPAWSHALADGEDFELLLAVAPEAWVDMVKDFAERSQNADWPALTVVGEVVAGSGLTVVDADGQTVVPERLGYEHILGCADVCGNRNL